MLVCLFQPTDMLSQPGSRSRHQVWTAYPGGADREHPHVPTTLGSLGVHADPSTRLPGGEAGEGAAVPKRLGLVLRNKIRVKN